MNRKLGRLTPLDVLLLVFVRHGLATTYDLRAQAGIGGSLTVKELQTLEENGLVTSLIVKDSRKSKRYTITEAGEHELDKTLDSGTRSQGRLGIESMARELFLEWLYPGRIVSAEAERVTQDAMAIYRKEKDLEAERCGAIMQRLAQQAPDGAYGSDVGQVVASTYMWIRAKADSALLKAQIEVLTELRPLTRKLPPTPKLEKAKQDGTPSKVGKIAPSDPSRWRSVKQRKRTE